MKDLMKLRPLRRAWAGMACLLIFGTGIVPVVLGQEAKGTDDDFVIANVQILGTSRAMGSIIYMSSDLKAGTTKDREGIQNSLKRLWSLGQFSSIEILQDSIHADSVYLTIQVKEHPRMKEFEINGNDEMKTKEVREHITMYPGQYVNQQRLKAVVEKLKEEYVKKGYLHANPAFELETADDNDALVNVKLNIDEGERVQVKRIRFFGNDSFEDKKLRGTFEETKVDAWWRGADFKPKEFEVDKEKLIEFYRTEGFREARVASDSLYYSDDGKDMFIDITVEEGAQFYFGAVAFEGNEIFNDDEMKGMLTFREGEQYSELTFAESQDAITTAYYDRGYVYITVAPREKIAGDTVSVDYFVREGEPARINRIDFISNSRTKDHVLRRELKLKPGDIFTKAALERSQRELMVLNYFANVQPGVQPMPSNQELVDITFEVEEKNTQTANMSAGYSQRDGLIGSLGLSMNNFRGNGQVLGLEWVFGRWYQNQSLSFTEPWFMQTPTLVGVTVYNSDRKSYYYPFDYASRGVSLRLGRRLKWPDDYFRIDYTLRVSQSEVSNVDEGMGLEDFLVGRTANAVSITQMIRRDSRDQVEFPTRGSVMVLQTELSGGPMGGQEDFLASHIKVQRFLPLFWKFVLYDNSEIGYIKGLGSGAYIPPMSRYYMGGTALTIGTAMRGYSERSLGPRSAGGGLYGGRVLTKFTTEVRFPIVPNPTVYGLFFAEAGNVWGDVSSMDLFGLKRSVGIGVRVFMPLVGLLGFDMAYGYDNDITDPATGRITGERRGEWRPHFQFGQSF